MQIYNKLGLSSIFLIVRLHLFI